MRYLLLDAQNLFFRASHAAKSNNIDVRVGMSLHITIMSIAAAWRMTGAEHVVLGLECSNKNNWRKVYDSRYKSNRAVKREAMTPKEQDDMEYLMAAFNDFASYLKEKTNVSVLQCPVAEADDMIAHWIDTHPNDEHVIVSTDKDFYQLVSDNVIQFNGVTKKLYVSPNNPMIEDDTFQLPFDMSWESSIEIIDDPEYLLFEKTIRGDVGDNVFSAFPGVRKKSGKGKPGILKAWEDRTDKGFEWNNFMLAKWTDHHGTEHVVRDRIKINNMLVNLRAHPEVVKDVMDEAIDVTKESVDSSKIGFHFFKLCNTYNLQKATEHAEEISRIFAAKASQ